MIDMRGAVSPAAAACPKHIAKTELVCSITPSRSVLSIRRVRLARLCVLMNPILPGARSIGDLAGFRILGIL
jgi:hypothetical protein